MKRKYNGDLDGWNHIPVAEKAMQPLSSQPSRFWKKKFECKKGKGKHIPALGYPKGKIFFGFGSGEWQMFSYFTKEPYPKEKQYRYVHCSVCLKHGIEYGNGKLKWY